MRARFGLAGFVLLALCSAGFATAEPSGSYGYITPYAGYTIFDGDLRYPRAPLKDGVNLGGRLGWQFSPWLGLEGAAGFTATNEDTSADAIDVDFFHWSGNLVLSPFTGNFGGPFVSLGFGFSQLKPASAGIEKLKQGNLEAAAGLNLWFNDMLGARFEARDLLWLNREEPTKIETHTFILGAGLTVALGGTPCVVSATRRAVFTLRAGAPRGKSRSIPASRCCAYR